MGRGKQKRIDREGRAGVPMGHMAIIHRQVMKCEVCGHEWLSGGRPKRCAKCKSMKWDEGRVLKGRYEEWKARKEGVADEVKQGVGKGGRAEGGEVRERGDGGDGGEVEERALGESEERKKCRHGLYYHPGCAGIEVARSAEGEEGGRADVEGGESAAGGRAAEKGRWGKRRGKEDGEKRMTSSEQMRIWREREHGN